MMPRCVVLEYPGSDPLENYGGEMTDPDEFAIIPTRDIERKIIRFARQRRLVFVGIAAFAVLIVLTGAWAPEQLWQTVLLVLAAVAVMASVAVAVAPPELQIKKLDTDLEAYAKGKHAIEQLTRLASLREKEKRKTQRLCLWAAIGFVLLAVLLPAFITDIGLIPSIIAIIAAVLFVLPALGVSRFRISLFGQSIEAKGANGKKR